MPALRRGHGGTVARALYRLSALGHIYLCAFRRYPPRVGADMRAVAWWLRLPARFQAQ